MPDATPHPIDYQDGRSRTITVAIFRRGTYEPCGNIEFNSAQNTGSFTYFDSYDGPPLDPINLDYRGEGTRRFAVNNTTSNDLLHRVHTDFLPGAWGLSVLQSEFPALKTMRACEKLHWFGSRTVGSLAYYVQQFADEQPVHGIDRLEQIRRQSVDLFLRRIEHLGIASSWIREGLTAFGGARPKCMFADQSGGQWLAKFNVDTDAYNYAKVEHGIAVLAKRCGIRAVETKALPVSPGADVLFVRRYDRVADTRPHRISALSLMREEVVRAQNEGDYAMMFKIIERICCDPRAEREELLRRMFFNVAINNVDDHLKNSEFLQDEQTGCFRMSPAYDVTVDPYPNQRVTAVFGLQRPSLGDETIEHIIRQSNFEPGLVYRIRDEIVSEVMHWRSLLAATGVAEQDLDRIQRGLEYGLRDTKAMKGAASIGARGHGA